MKCAYVEGSNPSARTIGQSGTGLAGLTGHDGDEVYPQ